MSSPVNRFIPWLLGFALLAFVVSLCLNPAQCNDLFWQLRAGQDIDLTRQAPHADAYSWTKHGTPWIAHEWLSFWLTWKLYQMGGFAGIWFGETALIAATFTLIYLHILKETSGSPITSFVLTGAAAILSSGFFQPRPHLWTYLFLAMMIAAMTQLRRSTASWRWSWLLPIVALFWANVHAGVLVGVGILFVFALGDVLEAYANPSSRDELLERAHRTAILGLACGAATLATPYGWRMYANMSATLGNSTAMNIVSEWASPDFHLADGKMLEIFVALLVYGVAFTRRKREWAPILILILVTHEALAANRNAPLFAIAGAMLFAADIQSSILRHFAPAGNSETSLFGRSPSLPSVIVVSATVVAASAIGFLSIVRSGGSAMPVAPRISTASFQLTSFPSAACRFIETEQFPRSIRLYNIYDMGGYLVWRLPQYPVFVDGRADIYFGPTLEDVHKMYELPYHWRALMDKYGADVVITTSTEKQSRLFLEADDWALVYADRSDLSVKPTDTDPRVNSLIFIKRRPEYRDLIARCRKDCPAAAGVQSALPATRYASLQ